jgi:uncharacterized protein with HEPN domain
MKDNRLESLKRLQHIAKAIDDINKYVASETVDSFINSDLIHDAVLFQFSVIGEAINFVEPEILEKYDYPWYKVRSFRNLISHEYFNIKMEAVWQIIQTGLPELQQVIQTILEKEF